MEDFTKFTTNESLNKRNETVLILPYNTLRIMDLPIHYEILKAKGLVQSDIDVELFKLLNRKHKDLAKFNGESDEVSEILRLTLKDDWMKYYELAPRTSMYDMLTTLKTQKFVKGVYALFPVEDGNDDSFDNLYYDGSIEKLEKIIDEYDITMLVMDDIELLDKLTMRKNVDFDYKTIIISKAGYNYHYDTDAKQFRLNNYSEIAERYAMEIGVVGLISFTKETIDKFNAEIKGENK